MMMRSGFSLIETVLYIGLLAILVPSFVMVTLGYVQKSETVDPRIRMEGKASVILSELQNELTTAQSVDVTNSSLATDDSSFIFVDGNGVSVTVSRLTDIVSFIGGDQEVDRLAWQTTTGTQWLTDSDMDVTIWNVRAVRDGNGVLTGVNVVLTVRVLNTDASPFRDITVTVDTTWHMQPYINEL